VAIVVAATMLDRLIGPVVEDRAIFLPFVLAIAIAAWLGGFIPGLVASLASTIAVSSVDLSPAGRLDLAVATDQLVAAIFLVAGCVVSGLVSNARWGRSRAERHAARTARLQAVTAAVGRQLRPAQVADAVLRDGLAAFGAGQGLVASHDAARGVARIISAVGFSDGAIEQFREFPIEANYPVGEVIRRKEIIVLPTGAALRKRYPDLAGNLLDGGTAVVVPLIYEDRAVGAMYWRFRSRLRFDDDDRANLLAIGHQAAGALERSRLYEVERRAAASSTFLSQASRILGSSLDERETVGEVARLAVADIADWCGVHVLEPDRTIVPFAVAHADPDKVRMVAAIFETWAPHLDQPEGIGAVIRTGRSEHVTWLPPDKVDGAVAREPALDGIVRAVRPRSWVIVPLIARERTLGALTFVFSESGRRVEPDDVELAEELGRRIATAIDNASLYRDLSAREAQQAAVARLGQLALESEELEPLLDATARELSATLGVEFAEILERPGDGGPLKLVAGVGWRDGLVGATTIPSGPGSQAGYTLLAQAPVIVTDLATETRFEPSELLRDHAVVSGMSVVIGTIESPWGALGVQTGRHRIFTQDDIHFLTAVANVIAGAVERKRTIDAEREAREVGRAFIGVVNHELRTPITTIYAGAKLLARMPAGEPDRAGIGQDVEAEAERLYRLTEDLLVLTRLERHDLSIAREPVLLSRLLERVVGSEQRRWPMTRFRLLPTPDLPPAAGEDSYIEQVARNLLTNAAKYSPANSIVEVVSEFVDGEVVVRVLDRGTGIGDSDPGELFGLFYRSPATAQQASGAGIGLFVCQRLMAAMGGRMWAANRPGGGSEFGFALTPYAIDEDAFETTERAVRVGEGSRLATLPG